MEKVFGITVRMLGPPTIASMMLAALRSQGCCKNQGGRNLGGPILKDKFFVYAYYELLRLRQQSPNNTTILSPAIQAGLAEATPTLPFTYQPVDQTTGNPSGPMQTVDLFARYPAFKPDPATLGVLKRIPTTANNNRVGDGINLLGYQFNARSNDTLDNAGFRADYNLNAHNTLTGTYSWNRQLVDRPDIDTSFDKIPIVTNHDKTLFFPPLGAGIRARTSRTRPALDLISLRPSLRLPRTSPSPVTC